MNFKSGIFWTIAIVAILTNLLFSVVSITEIYQLYFTDIAKEYHWGAEPFPWYYQDKRTYLTYVSSWTVLFLAILLFQIYYAVKDNKTKELYSGLLYILFFVVMQIANGQVE